MTEFDVTHENWRDGDMFVYRYGTLLRVGNADALPMKFRYRVRNAYRVLVYGRWWKKKKRPVYGRRRYSHHRN